MVEADRELSERPPPELHECLEWERDGILINIVSKSTLFGEERQRSVPKIVVTMAFQALSLLVRVCGHLSNC